MKKILFSALFLLIGSFAIAQEQNPAKADALKLVNIVSEPTTEMMFKQLNQFIPEKNQKAFREEAQKLMPDFFQLLANVYVEEFTHEEIKELLKFYETPIGKKLAAKTAILAEKGMKAGSEWGKNLQTIMYKYME